MGSAHNLKAAGSNPAPATKVKSDIKRLEPDRNTGELQARFYLNATSTFDKPPIDAQHDRAERANHAAAL